MNSFAHYSILPVFAVLFTIGTQAQLSVSNSLTPEQLVTQVLVGGGVSVSNVTYQGNNLMRGSFSNGHATNLGLDEGVVLASGNVNQVPNHPSVFASSGYGLPGDPTLNGITTSATHDAAVLEFDFVPTSDTLQFRYVFGSEEYKEYANSNYNDAFGFFVNGPQPGGSGVYSDYNLALIPGTNTPVTINTVNHVYNTQYYVDNENPQSGGTTIVYDGFTVVMTAMLVVVPCETYHIKLAVGDAFDDIYDSGVFLEANSFSSTGPSTNLTYTSSSIWFGGMVEACNDAQLVFQLDEFKDDPYWIVRQQTLGTATLDVDYGLSPSDDTLWIPVGELSVTLNVFPYSDNAVEGTETAEFIFEFAEGCDPTADTTILNIYDNTTDIPYFNLLNQFCDNEDPVPLLGSPPGGVFSGPGVVADTFYPALANNGLNEIFYTSYYIDVNVFGTDTICINDVMKEVYVFGDPDVFAGDDALIPEGDTYTITDAAAHNYDFVEWSTSGTGVFNDINIINPVYSPSIEDITAGSVTLSMYAEANEPCQGDSIDSMLLSIVSGTTALAGPDDAICEGMPYQLQGEALFYSYIEWTTAGDGSFSDPGILNPLYTPGNGDVAAGGVLLTMTAYGSSTHADDMYLDIGPMPVVDLGPDRYIPHGVWIDLNSDVVGGSGDFTYIWQPSDMLVNPNSPNPQTKNIYEDITFTLFVIDSETGCESEVANVNVIIDGPALGALPYAEPAVSCAGDNVQLFANPLGGDTTGYTAFLWISSPGGQTYGIENPIVSITEPTTFTLSFSDGYNPFATSIFVDLLPDPVVEIGGSFQIHCLYETVVLDAGNPGSEYEWSTGDTTQTLTVVTTGLSYDEQEYTVDVVNEYGCRGTGFTTVIFDFDACVGVDEAFRNSHFHIWPNPSDGTFNIESLGLDGETIVRVLNNNGIEVYSKTIYLKHEGFTDQLNLSGLGKGMYYIQFLGKDIKHSDKIILR